MSDTENETPDEQTTEPATSSDDEPAEQTDDEQLEHEPDDEPAEDDEQTGDEPPTDAPEAAVRTDKEMEQVFKALDRLRKDTAKRVGNIFGDDAVNLMDCPLCASVAPGYLWPPDVAPLAEEQTTALRLMLNMPVATDYQQSEDFMPCPKCDGLGRVRTGSKVQNHEVAECPRCFAKGYVPSPVREVHANGHAHEQDADLTTGPSRYGTELPTMDADTAAVIQSLKDRGFMVVEPLSPPRPAAL